MEIVFGNHYMDTVGIFTVIVSRPCQWTELELFFFFIMKCFMSSYIHPIKIQGYGDFT